MSEVHLDAFNSSQTYSDLVAGQDADVLSGNQTYSDSVAGQSTDYTLDIDPITGLEADSGYFVVKDSQVSVDFIWDGGSYQGEVRLYNLEGMHLYKPGSEPFIKEATGRSRSGSHLGHIAISDSVDKALFDVNYPWEGSSTYNRVKFLPMSPGDKFGIILVPDGTIEEVFQNPGISGKNRPLFSLNPGGVFHIGQLAAGGNIFVMEDKQVSLGKDRDYNDIVFQVKGAKGEVVSLDGLVNPNKDIRDLADWEDIQKPTNETPEFLQGFPQIDTTGDSINITGRVCDEDGVGDLKRVQVWWRPEGSDDWGNPVEITSFTPDSQDDRWGSFGYSLPQDLSPGSYELKLAAYDALDTASNEVTQTFRVNAAPNNLQFAIVENFYNPGDTIAISGGKVFDADGSAESFLTKAVQDDPNDPSLPQLYSGSNQWVFSSAAHWGESSLGDWTLEVLDENGNEVEGYWNSWKLKLYGTEAEVTVSAPQANASENGQAGQFTIARTGNTKHDLRVNYILGDTATNGTDYTALPRSVTIPAGQESVTVDISAIDDSDIESDETVKLTLRRDREYVPGAARFAEVTIRDNDLLAGNIVTNTKDSGPGSLRNAIEWANENSGKDTIEFNIPTSDSGYNSSTGAFTIQPRSELPEITDSIVIDGTTQAGFSSSPIIELSGTNAGSSPSGLTISGGNSTVRGLAINRFSEHGIFLNGSGGNLVKGNYIGTDVTGTQDLGNTSHGILVSNAANNTIGGTTPGAGNLVSGNDSRGIYIYGSSATGNKVLGNYVGTDLIGTKELGNASFGLQIHEGSNNIVGGIESGSGNLVSGNGQHGILLSGSYASANKLLGNKVGTDLTGTNTLANAGDGITIKGRNNIVGGTTGVARNLISGNKFAGIRIDGSGNQILGNYIGTDVTGSQDLGNDSVGLYILNGASNNTIGGTARGAGNTIAFHDGFADADGIGVTSNAGSGNAILGNSIFANVGLGIDLTIGGTARGAGNTIAFHDGFADADGISVTSNAGSGNAILGNSIFANVGLGIDLTENEITPNDRGDADTGSNNLQNFPVLTTATNSGGSTSIEGTLHSTPNSSFRVELFSNSDADPEGQTFLGFQQVTSDSSGNANFTVNLPTSVPVGSYITATATDSGNNTSEFSQGIAVSNSKPTVQIVATDSQASEAGDPGRITISCTGSTANPLTLSNYIGKQRLGIDSDTYSQGEGNSEWTSGEESTYENWGSGEPNLGTADNADRVPDSFSKLPGIIEIDPTSLEQPIVNTQVTEESAGENGNAEQLLIQRIGSIDTVNAKNYIVRFARVKQGYKSGK